MKHLAIILFLCSSASAAIVRVGHVGAGNGYMQNVTPNTTIATGPVNTGTGGFTLACVRWYSPSGETVSSVADTASNTYSALAAATLYANTSVRCYGAANTTANASNAVTFTMSTAVIYAWAYQVHYSGIETASVVAALDVYASKTQASGTGITSDAFTTAQAEEVLVAVVDVADLAGSWSATSPLTLIGQTGFNVGGLADEVVSSVQSSATRQMTNTSSAGKIMLMISLKAPASSPAVQKRRPVVFQ